MPTKMNNRALAIAIATATRTAGGYVYAGCEVRGLPMLRQTVWDCTGNYYPSQGDIAANKRRLLDAPEGTRVVFSTRCSDGEREEEIWNKTGPCRWELISHWAETRIDDAWEHIEIL
jgi:hypothetical protein